jgi:sulfoxide reductase heme-binding subunit YedZ
MEAAGRSSKQRQPGSGDWRGRLVRHHVPLAVAAAVVLVLFMAVPRFDANRYRHADLTSGAFPKERADRGRMRVGDGRSGAMRHGRRQGEASGHGAGGSGSMGHGGGQGSDHESGRGGSMGGHTGGQGGSMGGRGGRMSGSTGMPGEAFLGLGVRRFTVATGYLATGLLVLTLLIGPANLLLRRRNPVSSYLRRDVGVWTAVFSFVHVFYGVQVHQKLSNFVRYFVSSDGSPLTDSFGLANWTGLAATVIVAGLLALSSNAALRKLKARKWKRLQRLNYVLFALVVLHAFFYGALVRSDSPYTLLLLLSVVAVFVGQALGVGLYRRRYA